MNTTRDYTIGSVKKALEILKLFDEQHQELSLSELSELAGIGKSSMPLTRKPKSIVLGSKFIIWGS